MKMKFIKDKHKIGSIIILTLTISMTSLVAKDIASKAMVYGEKGVLYNNGYLKRFGDRNWRNNNPGNLECGEFTQSNNAIGCDGRFAIFPTMKDGFVAQIRLLKGNKYKDHTPKAAIKIYSPESDENDVKKYTKYLKKRIGKKLVNTKISEFSKKELRLLAWNMANYEGMGYGYIYKRKVK